MKTKRSTNPTRLALGAALAAASAVASAQGFALEGAVIDSRNGNSLGVINERGNINALFQAQKAMTFGILRSAGISLEQLPPEVRARIERFQTTNVEAFRAFSQGLDLKDQGRYAEARDAFRRATALDPSFALAADQQQAMPDVNVSSALQMRAVVQSAAAAAVDRGKATFVVDLSRALAALQAGATVVTVPATADASRASAERDYTSNQPGSTTQLLASQSVALSYSLGNDTATPVRVAGSNEYRGDEVKATAPVLDQIRTVRGELIAERGAALVGSTGGVELNDRSIAYWGQWISAPGASAIVTVSGSARSAPSLGVVDYAVGDAPRAMPNAGVATFVPAGGSLRSVTGDIAVNFATRDVNVRNLGFQIGSLSFSNLNGNTTFNPAVGSGPFQGNYSSGSCAGCGGTFTATSSLFSGNFIGRNADGLVFSTLLNVGSGAGTGSTTVGGVQVFKQP